MRAVFRSEGGTLETKQMTLAAAGFAIKTKVTRRAQFLAEMDKVVPWSRLLAVIEPHYPVAEQGRPRPPLERMLRIYFMQQWFNLSDPAMEDALYDSEAMRRFLRRSIRAPTSYRTRAPSCASAMCSRSTS